MEGTENDGCTPDDDMMIVRPFPDYPLQSAPEKEFFRNAGSYRDNDQVKNKVMIPLPANNFRVSCSAVSSCNRIQFSMGSIKDGNSICLFSIPVRLMEGVIKIY